MSEQPETLAAILAEMRDARNTASDTTLVSSDWLDDWATRIEAAAARETESLRVKMESEKRWACEYFDLARRREDALAHCKQYAQKIERENEEGETRLDAEEIIATVDNEFAGIRPARAHGNSAAMREALERIRPLVRAAGVTPYVPERKELVDCALGIIDSALAAPARNCDRFADELDAQLAFLNDVWLISVDKNTMLEKDKFENWTEQMKTRYGRWLLAPAEGGDHA